MMHQWQVGDTRLLTHPRQMSQVNAALCAADELECGFRILPSRPPSSQYSG